MVHVLSIPHLLTCAAIGTTFSVVFDRADLAKRSALGLVFALVLVESVTAGTEEYAWIGNASPMAYFEPTPILVDGTYRPLDAGVPLVVFVLLLAGSQLLFRRRDI